MEVSFIVRSRIYFFLIAKNLTKYVQKVDIHPWVAPVHWTISLSLQWTKEVPRGPGFWKFNNTLLNDDNYIQQIRRTYPETRTKYEYIQEKRALWELLKMELRSVTISYAKGKAKETSKREYTIKDELEKLDRIICNSRNLMTIDYELKQYEHLKKELQQLYEKKELQQLYEKKVKRQNLGQKVYGLKKGIVQPNISSILRKGTIV